MNWRVNRNMEIPRQRTAAISFGAPNHRGVPLIFAWGPHTGLSYQRPHWKQISLEQLKKDVIDKFAKWGANLVELYPSNKESHFDDYTCKENAAVPLHCFREHADADQENRWTTAGTTGIRVINEPLLSPQMKRYMAGICADPVRCAVAAKLTATGKDGRYRRNDYPKETWFIQNNFFRVYIEPQDAKADLYYDSAGQGNFTNFVWNTSSLLLKDFFSSRFAEDQRLDFHESEALEEAGARAILRQRCTFKSAKASMDEFRDYQTDADNPWLWIKIQRVFLGPECRRPVVNTLNLAGYQPLQEITQGKVSILDPPSGKPRLALFVAENDQLEKIEWDPAGKLNILAKPAESHEFKIGLMVAVPAQLDAEQLTRQARFLCEDLCFDMDRGLQREVVVPAAADAELVRAIQITNPPEGPYMVCENGWWQMRGAQPSWNRRDTDLLKVVLSPHAATRVRPYGFIDGAVKSG